MSEFFSGAPVGAIVLIVAGFALWLVEIPVRLRWKAQVDRQREGQVTESPSRLPLLITPLSWLLLIGGSAWYVLGAE